MASWMRRSDTGEVASARPHDKLLQVGRPLLLAVIASGMALIAVLNESAFWAGEAVFIPVALLVAWIGFARTRVFGWQVAVPTYYLLYFGLLPIAEIAGGLANHGDDSRLQMPLLLMSAALVAFAAAARLVPKSRVRAHPVGAMFKRSMGQAWWLLSLMLVGSWGHVFGAYYGYYGLGIALGTIDPLAGVATVASGMLPIATVVAYCQFMETREWKWGVMGLSATLFSVGVGMFARSKGAILGPLVIPGIVYFNYTQRVPWRLVTGTVLAYILAVYPFVTAWRVEGETQYRSRTEQFQEGMQILLAMEWPQGDMQGQGFGSMSRSLLRVTGDIVAETGDTTPFEAGSTYLTGVQAMVPRFLWPEKPNMEVGNLVGKKYGWLQASDDITNVAPTLPGEAYMNFGVAGVLVLMLAMGALASWIDGPLTVRMGTWFLTWSTVTGALSQESPFAHLVLPMIRALLLCVVVAAGTDLLLRAKNVPKAQIPL